jgi:flagellar hook assembly protein FlgD
VFSYNSDKSGSVYIDWDGRDKQGNELATGVYYYSASLEFETLQQSKRSATLKDWVSLVR